MAYTVGIDQATQCGYALLDERGQRLTSGTWDLSIGKGEGAGYRFVRFVGYLRGLLDNFALGPENGLIFFEQPINYGQSGARGRDPVGPALVGHLQYQAELRGIPYSPIAIASAKATASSGRASKAEMVEAANRRWGLKLPIAYPPPGALDSKGKPKLPTFPGGSDNEADALWIAETGRARIYGPPAHQPVALL